MDEKLVRSLAIQRIAYIILSRDSEQQLNETANDILTALENEFGYEIKKS